MRKCHSKVAMLQMNWLSMLLLAAWHALAGHAKSAVLALTASWGSLHYGHTVGSKALT